MLESPGVYSLVFPDGDVYIGSTLRSVRLRVYEHLYLLRRNSHENLHLQRLFNKYGVPVVTLLEECSDSESISQLEQLYLDQVPRDHLVNQGPAIPSEMFGRHHTQEAREKISQRSRNSTEETRRKISQANRGSRRSLESRRRMSEAHKRRWASYSPEYHRKIVDTLIQNQPKGPRGHRSLETRLKISQANKGRKLPPPTEEAHRNMSLGQKRRRQNAATRGH